MPVTLYALLTWTTRQRAPLINVEVARFLKGALAAIARRHHVDTLEIGIMNDHVHMLIWLPPRNDIPQLVQGLKGATARIANRDGIAKEPLRWASGYDLRSVGPRGIERVRRYLQNQVTHHRGHAPGSLA